MLSNIPTIRLLLFVKYPTPQIVLWVFIKFLSDFGFVINSAFLIKALNANKSGCLCGTGTHIFIANTGINMTTTSSINGDRNDDDPPKSQAASQPELTSNK